MQLDVENNILISELQLGEQLSQCIHSERRSDFSLMLAMLTDDVRDHSQFTLPVVEQTDAPNNEQYLREQLKLPNKVELAIKNLSELNCFNQAQQVVDGQLSSIHLENSLMPKPLAFYNDKNHIPTDVLSNTSVHCQSRYKHNNVKVAQRLSFNAKGWLDTIQLSIVNAPMLSV